MIQNKLKWYNFSMFKCVLSMVFIDLIMDYIKMISGQKNCECDGMGKPDDLHLRKSFIINNWHTQESIRNTS